MAKTSAGLLLWRRAPSGGDGAGAVQVLLGHPGGPYFARKDDGSWSVPKGEYVPGEEPLAAAYREFAEELGIEPPAGDPVPLGHAKGTGGKVLTAWAGEGEIDATTTRSNTFELEWPPRSGRMQDFPEIDRAAWLPVDEARTKLVKGQVPLLDRLLTILA